jgi:DNA-binding NtrC family response regulator
VLFRSTQKLLARSGYEILTAAGGTEALEILKQGSVHVVVLDVKMPGMDGLTALKEIKRLFPLVEVIMLTGHATVEYAVEGMRSGAADYLMKPVDPEVLIEKAMLAFEKQRHIEEKIRMAQARKPIQSK